MYTHMYVYIISAIKNLTVYKEGGSALVDDDEDSNIDDEIHLKNCK